jgi:VTC domain
MQDIENILSRFNKLSLEDINSVKLMNRVDVKYIFHNRDLEKILKNLSLDYEILEVNNSLKSHYDTCYFDTDNFEMYTMHHNGRANRHKVRIRTYKETDVSFVEVKFKNNKKKTSKSRVLRKTNNIQFSEKEKKFIEKKTSVDANNLQIALQNHFSRITLVNRKDFERVTIDTDINFMSNGKEIQMENLVICEIKKLPHNYQSIMEKELKKHRIKAFRISKYCLGSYLMNPNIKLNLFKEKYKYINKIITR